MSDPYAFATALCAVVSAGGFAVIAGVYVHYARQEGRR